jgi:hypothetical protein
LHLLAKDLKGLGIRTCGTVQINSDHADSGHCDMDVQVLPDGPILRISQTLGKESRGCRLDPAMLEQAVGLCEAELSNDPHILIVNKFGKHEADGRGFRTLIAEALQRGTPVLVGLNALSMEAFEKFSQGIAVRLQPDISDLRGWVESVLTLEPEDL